MPLSQYGDIVRLIRAVHVRKFLRLDGRGELASASMYTQVGNPPATDGIDRTAVKGAVPWQR
jgi:hypothetical protein